MAPVGGLSASDRHPSQAGSGLSDKTSLEQAEKNLLPLLLDTAQRMEKIIALDFENED